MKIPSDLTKREEFYNDVAYKCGVSMQTRKSDYASLRTWYLFGAGPDDNPAHYNKIYPIIDQLVSFIYSADTTRFSINLGAEAPDTEFSKIPVLTQALNDRWSDSNADQIFSQALTWSLAFNSTFMKLIVAKGGQIAPYMVDPGNIGVLREDVPYTDRQEAFMQRYYITKSDLADRLYSHPKKDSILERLTAAQRQPEEIPQGVDRIITSATQPNIYGVVNLDLSGYPRYKPEVAEETVEMKELWIWNTETSDHQVVTIADPGVLIYDRPGDTMFLKGESPFVQICPNPLYDYYWGMSEVQRLIFLQQMRNKRMTEILDILSKQVNPPKALMGFTGLQDEKDFSLNRAGGLFNSDNPSAKVQSLAPEMPPDLFKEIEQIDMMFAEASGISNVLAGRGEQGVRSSGHASQLARLGSSRAKKRALIVEDSLQKIATLYLKVMQAYDPTHYKDVNGAPFIAKQFTKDYMVKVDAHSNSPIFMEDLRSLAFNLFKAQAIDKESLIDLLEPPMKQLLKEKIKKQPPPQAAPPKGESDGEGQS